MQPAPWEGGPPQLPQASCSSLLAWRTMGRRDGTGAGGARARSVLKARASDASREWPQGRCAACASQLLRSHASSAGALACNGASARFPPTASALLPLQQPEHDALAGNRHEAVIRSRRGSERDWLSDRQGEDQGVAVGENRRREQGIGWAGGRVTGMRLGEHRGRRAQRHGRQSGAISSDGAGSGNTRENVRQVYRGARVQGGRERWGGDTHGRGPGGGCALPLNSSQQVPPCYS